MGVINMGIIVIFARELLEATLILGQYKTLIDRSPSLTPSEKVTSFRTVLLAALYASLLAVTMCITFGIILGLVGGTINDKAIELIEGISKVAASICILKLSLKIPRWLNIYGQAGSTTEGKVPSGSDKEKGKSEEDVALELTSKSALFWNVSWNIWREIGEAVVFLIPFFLADDSKNLNSIPVSIIVGTVVGILLGYIIYYCNTKFKNMIYLASFMSTLTALLAIGLFTYGAHEFEEVAEWEIETYQIPGSFWSHDEFPMVLIKIFGYSDHPTVVQVVSWWLSVFVCIGCHYRQAKKFRSDKTISSPSKDQQMGMIETVAITNTNDTAITTTGENAI